MLFSERTGIKPVRSQIQKESIDLKLKNGLWNCLTSSYWKKVNSAHLEKNNAMGALIQKIWLDYFKEPTDTIPFLWNDTLLTLRNYFFKTSWNDVYDFIEFIPKNYEHQVTNDAFISGCNTILKREVSAYRFIGGEIVEITSEHEILAIEEALANSTPLKSVYEHLKTALNLLADRESPNYRNSIKESISAVEAICKLITGRPKATLGQALKKLGEGNVKIHPALESAFQSMYGYTSDGDGIRHALIDETNLKFMDAKFMLVSCSAFINLLIEKSAEATIKL